LANIQQDDPITPVTARVLTWQKPLLL